MAHRPREIEQQASRHLLILHGERADRGLEPGSGGPALDRAQKTGLADAGIAGQQEKVPVTVAGIRQPPVRQLERIVTSEEDGADDRTGAGHGLRPTAAKKQAVDRRVVLLLRLERQARARWDPKPGDRGTRHQRIAAVAHEGHGLGLEQPVGHHDIGPDELRSPRSPGPRTGRHGR